MTTNLRVGRHARNWQIVSFMKNLFLEDELKYFFFRFYWDVCLFTLVNGGCGFHFAITLINSISIQFNSIQSNSLLPTKSLYTSTYINMSKI